MVGDVGLDRQCRVDLPGERFRIGSVLAVGIGDVIDDAPGARTAMTFNMGGSFTTCVAMVWQRPSR